MAHLAIVVPLVIGLIFLLLFFTFGSARDAVLILLTIRFAMVGGLLALFVGGLYLSVPTSVGLIDLFGVAVLNGAVLRLRPVLMTALVAALGLTPLLLATGPGSEIQRPLAMVVVGGLFSSTVLTPLVPPVLYQWVERRRRWRAPAEEDVPAPGSSLEVGT